MCEFCKNPTKWNTDDYSLVPKRDNPNWKPLTKRQFIELYKKMPNRTNISIGELLERAIIDGIVEEL